MALLSRRPRRPEGIQSSRRSLALARDVVIVVCAISAGIHAALTPEHLAESAGAGLGFLASAVVLVGLVVALTRQAPSAPVLIATVAVLAGLVGSYVLATTSGFPLLHPDPEPLDRLALVTKAVEVIGLLAAAHLLRRARPALAPTVPRTKGTPC